MNPSHSQSDGVPGVSLETVGDATLVVRLSGGWCLQKNVASASPVQKALATEQIRHVRFDAKALSSWDSSILIFLTKVTDLCRQKNIDSDREGLPNGIRRLLELAEKVPEQQGARQATDRPAFLARVGSTASDSYTSLSKMLHFLGEVTLAFVQLLKARARFRKGDLFLIIQECGPQVAFNCLRRFYRLDCSSSRTSALPDSIISKAFAANCDRSMSQFPKACPQTAIATPADFSLASRTERWFGVLRQAEHERKMLNHFKLRIVSPECLDR